MSDASYPSDREAVIRGHVPALDGLRGLAILLVLVYHHLVMRPATAFEGAVVEVGRAGWMGVDLFFVLSGFLITGILLDTRGAANYWRSFLARRALRILPLYFVVLAVGLLVIPALPLPESGALGRINAQYEATAERQLWLWSFLANVEIAREGWVLAPFDAFWSLSVEEQFYLLWPFLVLLLGRRPLALLCGAILVLSPLLRWGLLESGWDHRAVYVLTFCRLDPLAAGALAAALFRGPTPSATLHRLGLAALLAGTVASILSFSLAASSEPFAWWIQLGAYGSLALSFVGLLTLAALAPGGPLLGALTARWLRLFGRYSYALYIFHVPVHKALLFAGLGPDQLPKLLGSALPAQLLFMLIAIALSLLLAHLSWKFLEQPFLRLKRHFPRADACKASTSPS